MTSSIRNSCNHDVLCSRAKKTTSLIHLNTRSLVKKYDQFVFFLEQFSFRFNAIMLTETWFNSINRAPTLPGYNCFSTNRTNSRGGGIAIYISCDTGFFEEVPHFSSVTNDYEALCVQQHDVLFCVLYRPPSGNTEQFKSFVDGLLEYASYKKLRLFLGGDFNINLLGDSSCSNDMVHRIVASGFKNVIQTPTRVTVTSSSILDLLITNYDTTVTAAGTINSDLKEP